MNRYIAVIAVLTLFTVSVPTGWAQAGDMGGKAAAQSSQAALHKGTGTVTAVDNAKSKATITHGPIQTLKWPAMNMAFRVKDKALLDKLSTGNKVEFEFIQEGADYIITSVR